MAIIGRPNVGKSTLLNNLVGQKISITTRRPQTTRHVILGIRTLPQAQIVYVDTPGIHVKEIRAMNRYMNRSASAVLKEVDAILFVVEAMQWGGEDENVLKKIPFGRIPVLLVINKIDRMKRKEDLLPWIDVIAKKGPFRSVIPVSAVKKIQLDVLESELACTLPESDKLFSDDQVTDRTERFLAAEVIREKLMKKLGQEVPYSITVDIERFEDSSNLARIAAVVWVERESQKGIVIGKRGELLKSIGHSARLDLEKLLQKKVFLHLWVKVREGWADDEKALQKLGYTD